MQLHRHPYVRVFDDPQITFILLRDKVQLHYISYLGLMW